MICAFAPDLVCPCGQGTNYYLGTHESAEAAGLAYDQKARSLGLFRDSYRRHGYRHKVNFRRDEDQISHFRAICSESDEEPAAKRTCSTRPITPRHTIPGIPTPVSVATDMSMWM